MQEKTNVIFLDIDGVMNSQRYYTHVTSEQREQNRDKYGEGFDFVSKNLLNRLIHEFNAEVVIISVWRFSGLEAMRGMWKDRGMLGNIHGITRSLSLQQLSTGVEVPRGLEIQQYYENKFDFHHWTYDAPFVREIKENCTLRSYVIIDDNQDMLYEQRNNFVKCDELYGFTPKEYKAARRILLDEL